ncbi:MAG: YicC family protein [Proteobacteria bacterium]|nr:YicC family protein [Pseudomonadota bacterium]
MTINSMTGFARAAGHHAGRNWQWELKSVNGKALDLRLRLPPGQEHLEGPARAALSAQLKRGNVQVALVMQAGDGAGEVRVNEDLLGKLATVAEGLRKKLGGPPLQAEQLLALRGVIDVSEPALDDEGQAALDKAVLASLAEAVTALAKARAAEGLRLKTVLTEQISRITELTRQAKENPSRSPEAIRSRLKEQVSRLIESSSSFDEARLHQEAILLATRADIQEELDRLSSHIEAAHELLASREPVGRKFDFLAQEFNREANTLCSKANDRSLTATGLDLKTVIDQMREQVQNIE